MKPPLSLDIDVDGRRRAVQVSQVGSRFEVMLDGTRHVVDAVPTGPGRWSLLTEDRRSHEAAVLNGDRGPSAVLVDGSAVPIAVRDPRRRRRGTGREQGEGPARITAPMPGKIVRVLAAPGEAVAARQGVVVIEAMKMENELRAPRAGTVAEVLVHEGDLVDAGAPLLTIG